MIKIGTGWRTKMSTMVCKTGDGALGFFALVVAAAVIGAPFALVLFAPLVAAL